MYTTKDVESILRRHRETTAQIIMLEMLLEERQRGYLPEQTDLLTVEVTCEQLDRLRTEVRLVGAWLAMLSPEEQFVLETHTIGGLDWTRTIIEHEQKWGREQGRSDRTLKRIQAKAIRKIWLATNKWLYNAKQD